MPILIRAATEADFTWLPDVEADAAEAFRDWGLDEIANMAPATAASYQSLAEGTAVFVALDEVAAVIDFAVISGFAMITRVDGEAYLKEVAVRKAHAGQGIGRKLIDAAVTWSWTKGYRHMTLTTFADLPFNAPFYRKIGFSPFDPDQTWPELRAIRENERKIGLEVRQRVAMIRSLQGPG